MWIAILVWIVVIIFGVLAIRNLSMNTYPNCPSDNDPNTCPCNNCINARSK